MQNSLLTKGLVLGILMLFVGTTISQNAITKNPSDAASKFNPTDDSYVGDPNDINGDFSYIAVTTPRHKQ